MDSKGKLNIYKVSGDELRAIAGIGKGTAKAIIDLRESVPVITEEHLNTIAQLRNNEEFWAVIDLLPPQKVNFETPPTVSLNRAEGDIVRPRGDSLREMPDIDTPSSRAILAEPDVDRGVDTPKRDQGGSMSSKRLFFGMSQDNTLNKNLGSPRQPRGGADWTETRPKQRGLGEPSRDFYKPQPGWGRRDRTRDRGDPQQGWSTHKRGLGGAGNAPPEFQEAGYLGYDAGRGPTPRGEWGYEEQYEWDRPQMGPEWGPPDNRWVWYPYGPSHPMGFPVMNQGYGGAWGRMGVRGFAGPGQEHTREMLSPQLDREQGTKQWGENKPSRGPIIIDGRYMGSTGGLGPRTSTGEKGRETYQGSYNPRPGGRDQGGRGPGRETDGETGNEYVALGEREGARGRAARMGDTREEIEEYRGEEEEPLDNVGEYEPGARAGGPRISWGNPTTERVDPGVRPGVGIEANREPGGRVHGRPGIAGEIPREQGAHERGIIPQQGLRYLGEVPQVRREIPQGLLDRGVNPLERNANMGGRPQDGYERGGDLRQWDVDRGGDPQQGYVDWEDRPQGAYEQGEGPRPGYANMGGRPQGQGVEYQGGRVRPMIRGERPRGARVVNGGMERRFPTMPKGLTFDGSGNWHFFQTKYNSFARAQGWSEREKCEYVCWCLEGKASEFYMLHAEENVDMTFEQLGMKFAKRFGFRELPETALVIFNNAAQLSEESLDDWADRVLTLASKAFRSLPEEYLSQQAILKFCQGSTDREAGERVTNQRPTSMEGALDKMKWAIQTRKMIFGKGRREVRAVSPDVNVAAVRPALSDMGGRVDKVESQVELINKQLSAILGKLEALTTSRERPRTQSPMGRRSPSLSPNRMQCFKCGQAGHFKRECPQWEREGKKPDEGPKEKKVTFEVGQEGLNTKGAEQGGKPQSQTS